jgi:hypothetical protein
MSKSDDTIALETDKIKAGSLVSLPVAITMPTPAFGFGTLRSGEWRCGCGKIKSGSCKACKSCNAERPKGLGGAK